MLQFWISNSTADCLPLSVRRMNSIRSSAKWLLVFIAYGHTIIDALNCSLFSHAQSPFSRLCTWSLRWRTAHFYWYWTFTVLISVSLLSSQLLRKRHLTFNISVYPPFVNDAFFCKMGFFCAIFERWCLSVYKSYCSTFYFFSYSFKKKHFSRNEERKVWQITKRRISSNERQPD